MRNIIYQTNRTYTFTTSTTLTAQMWFILDNNNPFLKISFMRLYCTFCHMVLVTYFQEKTSTSLFVSLSNVHINYDYI